MIPKIIHYCWFGGSEIPLEFKNYIKKWKSLNPGYKIIEWNEKNSPVKIPYIKKAISKKNWANASNLVRFLALKEYGGIYMDTDMKLLKPLKPLLSNECFMGFEEGEKGSANFWVNNAIIGAVPQHKFIKLCASAIIKNFDGTEAANLSAPQIVTTLLKKHRKLKEYGFQKLGDITLYPKEVFYPIHYNEAYKLKNADKYVSTNTIGIHVWARTWLTHKNLLETIDHLRKWSDDLQKYNNDLKKDNEYERNLNTDLNSKIHGFEKRLESLQNERTSDTNTMKGLHSKIDELNSAINELRTWSDDLEKHNAELKKDNDYERRVNAYLQANVNTLESQAKGVLQKIETSLKNLTESTALINRLHLTNEEQQKRIVTLENEVITQLKKNESALETVNDKNIEIANLKNSQGSLESKVKESDNMLSAYMEDKKTNNIRIAELQNIIAGLTEKINILNINEVSLSEKISHLSETLRKNEETNKLKDQSLIELQRTNKDLKNEKDELTKAIQQAELKHSEEKNKTLQLENKISTLNEWNIIANNLATELKQSNAIIETNSKGIINLLNDIKVKEEEISEQKSKIDQNKHEHSVLTDQYNSALTQYQNAKEAIEQLMGELSWHKRTYEERKLIGIIKDRVLKKKK